MATHVPEIKIVEVVKALVVAAGMASAVAHGDIDAAAGKLSRQYGESSQREVAAEIARHLRNKG